MIDLYSRQIVGWSMAEHMRTKLVNDALLMAVWKRKPEKGLLWHTDRGSQYASDSHRALLKQHGIQQSMSRKGNCWDNAVSESFFHTLKTEFCTLGVHVAAFRPVGPSSFRGKNWQPWLRPSPLATYAARSCPIFGSCLTLTWSMHRRYSLSLNQRHYI